MECSLSRIIVSARAPPVKYICSLGSHDFVWLHWIYTISLCTWIHICILRSWNVAYEFMITKNIMRSYVRIHMYEFIYEFMNSQLNEFIIMKSYTNSYYVTGVEFCWACLSSIKETLENFKLRGYQRNQSQRQYPEGANRSSQGFQAGEGGW